MSKIDEIALDGSEPSLNGNGEGLANRLKAQPTKPAFDVAKCGFVHHTFENKYYENKGNVWGPATVDDIKRAFRVVYDMDADDQDAAIFAIRREAQIHQAVNVAGCKAGVQEDKRGHRYLVVQSHELVEPIRGDWSIIREIIESMFGEEQTPYVYAWLQWAYLCYETRTLAPGQLFVMVGPQNCGKTLVQERIISRLLGSNTARPLDYLMGKTEFNADLIANASWGMSDEISDMNWQQRKILTEGCKEAMVNTEKRLRGLYNNPCVVDMVPRISCAINWSSLEALPLFEEGMSDKMILFKVEKSSRLPTAEEPREEFGAKIDDALPGFAYFLKHPRHLSKVAARITRSLRSHC